MTNDVDTRHVRFVAEQGYCGALLNQCADTIDALRARVAELEGKVAGYEAEMIAAADYLRESKVIIDNATEAIRLIGDEKGGER